MIYPGFIVLTPKKKSVFSDETWFCQIFFCKNVKQSASRPKNGHNLCLIVKMALLNKESSSAPHDILVYVYIASKRLISNDQIP